MLLNTAVLKESQNGIKHLCGNITHFESFQQGFNLLWYLKQKCQLKFLSASEFVVLNIGLISGCPEIWHHGKLKFNSRLLKPEASSIALCMMGQGGSSWEEAMFVVSINKGLLCHLNVINLAVKGESPVVAADGGWSYQQCYARVARLRVGKSNR